MMILYACMYLINDIKYGLFDDIVDSYYLDSQIKDDVHFLILEVKLNHLLMNHFFCVLILLS